jgi:hypothetical protein
MEQSQLLDCIDVRLVKEQLRLLGHDVTDDVILSFVKGLAGSAEQQSADGDTAGAGAGQAVKRQAAGGVVVLQVKPESQRNLSQRFGSAATLRLCLECGQPCGTLCYGSATQQLQQQATTTQNAHSMAASMPSDTFSALCTQMASRHGFGIIPALIWRYLALYCFLSYSPLTL